jgi:hypothetical protein
VVWKKENRDALVLADNTELFVACHEGSSFCCQRHGQKPVIIRIAANASGKRFRFAHLRICFHPLDDITGF